MLSKKEELLKDHYPVNEKEYSRLLLKEKIDVKNFEAWKIFYKWVGIHKNLNDIFQNDSFIYKLLFSHAYSNLIVDKNKDGCIGELTEFSFDHTSSMQLRSDVCRVECADTITGIITFPYFHDWNEIKDWIDKVPENNYSVYIINPILINYGVGTVGLFLTPKFYNGHYIELCNRYIIGLTGYPLFLTFSIDENVDEIHYVDLGLSKEDYIDELFELSGENKALLKMLNFWKDNEEVSIPIIENSFESYLDVQSYRAPYNINFIRIISKKPFTLVQEDTKCRVGKFKEFTLDEPFKLIDTDNGEFKLSDDQLKDLLEGKYDFVIV